MGEHTPILAYAVNTYIGTSPRSRYFARKQVRASEQEPQGKPFENLHAAFMLRSACILEGAQ